MPDLVPIQPEVQPGAFVPTSELLDGIHTTLRRYDMDAADRLWQDLLARGDEEILQNVDLVLKVPGLDRVYQRGRFRVWGPSLDAVAARALEAAPRDFRALKLRIGVLLELAFAERKVAGGEVDSVRYETVDPARKAMAEELITTWNSVAPDSTAPWLMRGTLCALSNDAAGEAAAFAKAVAINPKDPEAWFRKAEAHMVREQAVDALYAVERALELNPGNGLYEEFRDDCLAAIPEEESRPGAGTPKPG